MGVISIDHGDPKLTYHWAPPLWDMENAGKSTGFHRRLATIRPGKAAHCGRPAKPPGTRADLVWGFWEKFIAGENHEMVDCYGTSWNIREYHGIWSTIPMASSFLSQIEYESIELKVMFVRIDVDWSTKHRRKNQRKQLLFNPPYGYTFFFAVFKQQQQQQQQQQQSQQQSQRIARPATRDPPPLVGSSPGASASAPGSRDHLRNYKNHRVLMVFFLPRKMTSWSLWRLNFATFIWMHIYIYVYKYIYIYVCVCVYM